MKTLAIIGGGAAGLAAAVESARCARQRGVDLRVVVYEADEKIGRSILRSGNGRCNFSNANICAWDEGSLADLYQNGSFVAQVLQELERSAVDFPLQAGSVSANALEGGQIEGFGYASNQVLAFFQELGLAWRQEGEGRLYPYANKAQSLLDALRRSLAKYQVEVRLESPVAAVEPLQGHGERVTLRMADGAFERADQVIVAAGGTIARTLLDAAAVSFLSTRPVLGPLAAWPMCEPLPAGEACRGLAGAGGAAARVSGSRKGKRKARGSEGPASAVLNGLDNIRVRCEVALVRPADDGPRTVFVERGEVLFRKYGLSGIAVFNLSRFARAGDVLQVDLLPDVLAGQIADLLAFRSSASEEPAAVLLQGFLLPNVARAVCRQAGVDPEGFLDERRAADIAQACKCLAFQVLGVGDRLQCQVHRGGVDVSQVSSRSLQLAAAPSVRVVGEALDVDAPCGGYNLHWAWASGLLAARSVVADL